MTNALIKIGLAAGCLLFAGMMEQDNDHKTPAQVVALDECDPATFNAAVGAGLLQKRGAGRIRPDCDVIFRRAGRNSRQG